MTCLGRVKICAMLHRIPYACSLGNSRSEKGGIVRFIVNSFHCKKLFNSLKQAINRQKTSCSICNACAINNTHHFIKTMLTIMPICARNDQIFIMFFDGFNNHPNFNSTLLLFCYQVPKVSSSKS